MPFSTCTHVDTLVRIPVTLNSLLPHTSTLFNTTLSHFHHPPPNYLPANSSSASSSATSSSPADTIVTSASRVFSSVCVGRTTARQCVNGCDGVSSSSSKMPGGCGNISSIQTTIQLHANTQLLVFNHTWAPTHLAHYTPPYHPPPNTHLLLLPRRRLQPQLLSLCLSCLTLLTRSLLLLLW